MEKRKIALLASVWDTEVLEGIIEGVRKRLDIIGWDLYVYICFPVFGMESPDNFGNFNIFSLPDYKSYEGFLLAVNSVHGYEMLKRYYPKVFTCGKPMVSLEKEIEGVTTIVPDGYQAIYQLVEHLITEHGCRTLNYVGGSTNHADNIIRKKAYMDALAVHGIPVEEKRIRDYSFVISNGRQAYMDFKSMGMETPDAVVCANDAMALGYCQAAEEDGKYPPEDFLITGYDNDEYTKEFTPMLTTVDKKAPEMGYVGCDTLLKVIAGEKVEQTIYYQPEIVLHGSCGCFAPEEIEKEKVSIRQLYRRMYAELKEETAFQEKVAWIRQNLALAGTEGLFNYYVVETFKEYDIYGFGLCINQDVYYSTLSVENTWKPGYSKNQYLMSSLKEGVSPDEPILLKTKHLYPDYLYVRDDKCHVYMFVPIQKMGAGLGYIVVVDGLSMLKRNMIRHISSAIGNAYSNLRNLENLRKINKRLDNVYTKDAMTDLYNRFGYMRDGYEMYEKSKVYRRPLMVMFMDMDRLKYINDTFGHSQGDEALIRFSNVLKKCVGEKKIAVRYGGDEFLIIGQVENGTEAEEFKKQLEAELDAANAQEGYAYQLEASIGYVLTDPKGRKELDAYVEEADSLMYEVKKRNRKQRA